MKSSFFAWRRTNILVSNVLSLRDIKKTYGSGNSSFEALTGVSLDVSEGESLAIVGSSGSGKSTLLHIMGCLDTPDAGSIRYRDKEISGFRPRETNALRNSEFGFVFQNFYLEQSASVLENVEMPLVINRTKNRRPIVEAVLDRLGLADRIDDKAGALSGGQKQRVAIARALVNNPFVIFADEPTGSLDSTNGAMVSDLLFGLNETDGVVLVMVTHSGGLAARCSRQVTISDGALISAPFVAAVVR